MSLNEMKKAMLKFMESGVGVVQDKINALTDEERSKLVTEAGLKNLRDIFEDKNTATFLTQEDHLSIVLLLAKRGVAAAKKQMEEENNEK